MLADFRIGDHDPIMDNDFPQILCSGYICRLCISYASDQLGRMLLELCVQSQPVGGAGEIRLRFEGVRDLEIGNLNGLKFCHLGIEDIRERQLEGLRYAVSDAEGDLISFKCDSWTNVG